MASFFLQECFFGSFFSKIMPEVGGAACTRVRLRQCVYGICLFFMNSDKFLYVLVKQRNEKVPGFKAKFAYC